MYITAESSKRLEEIPRYDALKKYQTTKNTISPIKIDQNIEKLNSLAIGISFFAAKKNDT